MQKFQNILYISQGLTDESESLKQALSIARNNKAEMGALILCPELPKEMSKYRNKYETSLTEQLRASLQACRDSIKVSEADVSVKIELECGGTPDLKIVRHVLKNAHDLVIKEAEPKEGEKGFKAMDMELLRKCPCPVWLSRPIDKHRDQINVAVAIDPTSEAPEGHDLSLRLLKLSRNLADTCSGNLHIISCWEYEFEGDMRHNPWIKMPEEEITKAINTELDFHRTGLDKLINESGIGGKNEVHHIRGRTDKVIPQHVLDKGIDILVMGTVARTGIAGFVIGNTAENIVQNLTCSLLALKPNGFVSPIKAY
jgi:nucleotide-binding universal stress UspA family protein